MTTESKRLPVNLLDFDPSNPRFPEKIARGATDALLERFIRDERLLEIIESIADQGYFEGEPLLVVKHGDRYLVVEGNRRLAALKLLVGELRAPEGRISVDEACKAANNRPQEVPCLIFKSSDQILRYLGFRHITGIKAWGSLQKARYLKRMKDRFYQSCGENEQLTKLAREIGSRPTYVGQVLAALNLYERAETNMFYEVQGLEPAEIDFSVLSTALGYTAITKYIGLYDRKDMVGKDVSDEHLKNLLTDVCCER